MTEPLIPLKPCPFCGGKNVEIEHRSDDLTSPPHWYAVVCQEPNCGCEGPYDLGNSGACEAWNTRPIEAQLYEACKNEVIDIANLASMVDPSLTKRLMTAVYAAIAAYEGAP